MKFKFNILRHRLFLLLLVISISMWYINKLGYKYKTDIDIPIEITFDHTSFGWIDNPTMTINCLVEADGSELLRYKIGTIDAIRIPVSSLDLTNVGSDHYTISTTSLKEALNVAQNRVTVFQMIDTISRIRVVPMQSITLPIKNNIKIGCAKQFMVEGRVTLQPSEIAVRAPRSVLDTLRYIQTESLEFVNQKKTLSATALLIIPQGVITPQTTVRYSAQITGYTELEYTLPVEMSNLEQDMTMISTPAQVMVLVKVPLKSFDYKGNGKPVATIDYNDRETRKSNLYKVSISNLPVGGEVTLIRPEYVEPFFTHNH